MRSGLFLAELIVGLRVDSLSLLAVAVHMMVDVLSIAIALIVAVLTRRSNLVDSNSSYSEARSALFDSSLLLGIAAFIYREAIQRFQNPRVSTGLPISIVTILGFAVKRFNAALLYEESHHNLGYNLNIRGVIFHAIADAVNSIALLLTSVVVFC